MIVVVALMVLVVVGLLLAPGFVRPMIEEEVLTRLRRRLDTTVEIEEIDVEWGRVALRGVEIGGGNDPTIKLTEIDVALDEDALWDGRVVADDVVVRGGEIRGERASLEAFARRVTKSRAEPEPKKKGRVHMVPKTLAVEEVWLVVTDPGDGERPRRLEARLDVTAETAGRTLDLTARDVIIDPGQGPVVHAGEIATALTAVRTETGIGVQFPLSVRMQDVGAPLTEQIAISGTDGSVTIPRADLHEISIDIAGSFGGDAADEAHSGKLWSAAGRVTRDFSEGELTLDMEAFELGRVPSVLARLPLVESESATVGGHVSVLLREGIIRLEGDVGIEGLNVDEPLLARKVVRDIGFDMSFGAEVDPQQRRATIHYADISRRGVDVSLVAEVEAPPQRHGRHYAMRASMPNTPCQSVLDAIPDELVPSLTEFKLDGEIDAEVEIDVDFANLDALILGGDIGIRKCGVRSTPPHADAQRLASGFTHRVMMRDGRTATVQLYGGSRNFTTLRQISPYVLSAVQSTEDGGFWRHEGFLPSQFKVALVRNLKAGKVRLGASTITMQMVKNVLLSQERTLARKLQEMFLTWYVETALDKSRIMELYLNAIEYGPGIYGITSASRHYFGKHPADLTPPEAVYLALMLPSPVRRHAQYCRGGLTPNFVGKVQYILGVMNSRGRLSDLEFELWKDEPVEFDLRKRGSESACYGLIKRVQDGTYTQRALSGLLGGEEFFDDVPPPPPTVDGEFDDDTSATGGQYEPGGDAPGTPAMDEPR